ncbi:hypothetical protein [Dysgonomonas sp. 511]|uniref:hypothetical protein n=1 Tax=Dysgonomonas sp. 511 TaxID=2302930 RepID=UPI0013D55A01|nr:hypothetical protein [Dysgonomonas sp. 511]
MKIIYNSYLPGKKYKAINLFGVVFARKDKGLLSDTNQNHEAIHTRQGREMLWLIFYLWYIIEWVIRIIQYRDRNKAYYNISFEREAYANDGNLEYLKNRKLFAFVKYLKDGTDN